MVIGPVIPAHLLKGAQGATTEDDGESSDDDYGPALPPDVASGSKPVRAPIGPSFPTSAPPVRGHDESDDEYGPTPLPAGPAPEEDGVRNFLEREERRQKAIEEDAKPKVLKRDEWMLKPPEVSNILSTLDPTKLKARQFSRNTEEKVKDQTLWTETPAERQQRLADEVTGKRKRAETAAGGNAVTEESLEDRKKRKRDREIMEQVQEHTKKNRGESLMDLHGKTATSSNDTKDSAPPAIWDRDRDMGMGGRLMDDKARSKLVKDAKDLGSRFGRSSSGGFL